MDERKITARKDAEYFESVNLWEAAAHEWIKAGRKEDAIACWTIRNAIEKGNAFRKEVQEKIGPEPELTSSTIKAWQQWHADLRDIYNTHFKPSKDEA